MPLNFAQQRYEADFRFSLARLREYAEQVALLEGETAERQIVMGRFGNVIHNFWSIVNLRKRLMAFTASYGQISPIIPYVIAAPFYFLGKVQLGVLLADGRCIRPRRRRAEHSSSATTSAWRSTKPSSTA